MLNFNLSHQQMSSGFRNTYIEHMNILDHGIYTQLRISFRIPTGILSVSMKSLAFVCGSSIGAGGAEDWPLLAGLVCLPFLLRCRSHMGPRWRSRPAASPQLSLLSDVFL